MSPDVRFTPGELRSLPTICLGQCCSLKVEDDKHRVWLCRVEGGVTVETLDQRTGRWETTSGHCWAEEAWT